MTGDGDMTDDDDVTDDGDVTDSGDVTGPGTRRRRARALREFLDTEVAGAVVLLVAVIAAPVGLPDQAVRDPTPAIIGPASPR